MNNLKIIERLGTLSMMYAFPVFVIHPEMYKGWVYAGKFKDAYGIESECYFKRFVELTYPN